MGDIIWCLSFTVWLTSLSMIVSRSIHVAANGIISFFLWLSNIPLCISSLSTPLLMDIVLFSCLGYCYSHFIEWETSGRRSDNLMAHSWVGELQTEAFWYRFNLLCTFLHTSSLAHVHSFRRYGLTCTNSDSDRQILDIGNTLNTLLISYRAWQETWEFEPSICCL